MDDHGTPMQVLVIDQNESWRQVLVRGLGAHGFTVCRAATVREARDIVKREEVRAIVLDLLFPDGHGLHLLPELRRLRPDAPVLVCTAHGSIAAAVAAIRTGAHDLLLKPTTVEQVVASLRLALAGQERERPPVQWVIPPKPMSLDRVHWEHLQRVLMECDWNISEAARRLRIHRQSLQRKLRQTPPLSDR